MQESKKGKNLNLAKELKKLWNMKMTVIPLVVGDFRMIPPKNEKRLRKPEIR